MIKPKHVFHAIRSLRYAFEVQQAQHGLEIAKRDVLEPDVNRARVRSGLFVAREGNVVSQLFFFLTFVAPSQTMGKKHRQNSLRSVDTQNKACQILAPCIGKHFLEDTALRGEQFAMRNDGFWQRRIGAGLSVVGVVDLRLNETVKKTEGEGRQNRRNKLRVW